MTDSGVVIEVKGNLVFVETESSGGCSACQMNKKCMMSADSKKCTVIAKNNGNNVKKGDKVIYSFKESYFIGISAALYLIPAVFIVISASLGYFAGKEYFSDGDIGAILGFAAGTLISILFIRFSGKIYGNYPLIVDVIRQ
ncbi:MAG: SoxR reducing system RseC family protein [Spirochaetes bacterium]|nr:SoxR reducing system RseC family protein [Spirochaetota bacterium]